MQEALVVMLAGGNGGNGNAGGSAISVQSNGVSLNNWKYQGGGGGGGGGQTLAHQIL